MCNQHQLNSILDRVASAARDIFGEKLQSILLYGSYARGDFDDESDIDVMILLNVPREQLSSYRMDMARLSSDLGLQYDVVVSLHLQEYDLFRAYQDTLPFYRNVWKEGVQIA